MATTKFINGRAFLFAAGLMFSSLSPRVTQAERVLSGNERGLYYALPVQCKGSFECSDWSGIGAYVGQFTYQNFYNSMDPDSLKLPHGRFQHFAPFDDWTEALFPYAEFAQYDASEVAAGRTSLFVSATYQGKIRPVLWNWYGVTSEPYGNNPGRAVNLKDERFIQFWINQYIHPWLAKINKPNVAVLMDNCSFGYGRYGVMDDSGAFVGGVSWNQPYAQNQAEFLDSINNFFARVHEIDPSIKVACNTDAQEPPSEFSLSFQNIDGISVENMEYLYQSGGDWWREAFYNQFTNTSWIGNQGKFGLLMWQVPTGNTASALRRDYVHYLMVRGDNFFFAPQFDIAEVPPSSYSAMKSTLGLPTQAAVVTQEPGRPQGYALYSRETAHGIAYLNWSGAPKTIILPAGHTYLDSSGNPTTQITVADMDGDYVSYVQDNSATVQDNSAAANLRGTTYLSDLAWTSVTNGWGPVEINRSNGEADPKDGHVISLRGTTYAVGLGAHAKSNIQYDLSGRVCTSLVSDFGIDDETSGRGSATFQVWGDGKLLYDSGVVTGKSPAKILNVGVNGVKTLSLVAIDAGDGINFDHVDWAAPKLSCQ